MTEKKLGQWAGSVASGAHCSVGMWYVWGNLDSENEIKNAIFTSFPVSLYKEPRTDVLSHFGARELNYISRENCIKTVLEVNFQVKRFCF